MNEKYYLNSDIKEIVNNLNKFSKYFEGKKFLISGANGFLGKYFIKSLITINQNLKKKIKILAIDIKFDNSEIYSDKNVIKKKLDINKFKKIKFKSNYVLHAAGIPSPKHYYNKPIDAIFTSITATKNLLEYSKENKSKFIFFVVVKYMEILMLKIFQRKKPIMEMYHALRTGRVMMKEKE